MESIWWDCSRIVRIYEVAEHENHVSIQKEYDDADRNPMAWDIDEEGMCDLYSYICI